MPYTPTQKTVDTRFIGRNILAYILETQAEALAMANEGESGSLIPFRQIIDSVVNRPDPVMPSIALATVSFAQRSDTDVPEVIYEATLELWIGSSNPVGLFLKANRYGYAVESLLENIPNQILTQDCVGTQSAGVILKQTQYDEIGTTDQRNYFAQRIQIKASFKLFFGLNE